MEIISLLFYLSFADFQRCFASGSCIFSNAFQTGISLYVDTNLTAYEHCFNDTSGAPDLWYAIQ